MLQRHGRLLALYHDRHGIFQQTGKASEADTLKEQLVGKTQPNLNASWKNWKSPRLQLVLPKRKGVWRDSLEPMPDRSVIELLEARCEHPRAGQ
jgi:hypothetical protein